MAFRTDLFEAYIAPARAYPQIWRVFCGFLIIIVAFYAGTFALLDFASTQGWLDVSSEELELNTRTSIIIFCLTFGAIFLGAWAVVRLIHKRSFRSLLYPENQAVSQKSAFFRNFAIAAGVIFIVHGILMFVTGALQGSTPNIPFLTVLVFLPITVAPLLLQTGAEELLLRGYLMQQLAARFQNPVIWFVFPAVFFGVVHHDLETMPHMAWWIVALVTLSGLALADLTRITGNIGAAWGWHFMNNFMLLNFMTMPGTMEGFAWKLTTVGPDEITPWTLLPDFCASIACWLLLRRILRPAQT